MAKNKHPKHKVIIGELIFWLHTVILAAISVAGFFMAWWWVVLILVIVRAQQIVFHGCILTIMQAKEGGIKRGMAYYQIAARRFFGVRLSKTGVHLVSYGQFLVAMAVALAANYYHVRIPLS